MRSWLKAEAWLNVAFPHNQGFKDESDSALKEALNEVCNMTLTALLKEDEEEIISITDELYSLGEFFSKQGPPSRTQYHHLMTVLGNRKAAVLMFILYKLCNHQIPEAADTLDGLYKEAYLKIGGMLEDSGWELKHEREEKDDDSPDNTSVSHLSDLQS